MRTSTKFISILALAIFALGLSMPNVQAAPSPDGVNSAPNTSLPVGVGNNQLPIGAGGNTVIYIGDNYITSFLNAAKVATISIDSNNRFMDINGTMRVSPYPNFGSSPLTSTPSGWGMGLWTWDVFAEGSVGVGYNGTLTAYMTRSGDISASGNIYASNTVNIGGQVADATTILIANTLKGCADGETVVKQGGSFVCRAAGSGIQFGGLYEIVSNRWGGMLSCDANPATGGCSCPPGFNSHHVHWNNTGGANLQYNVYQCTNP